MKSLGSAEPKPETGGGPDPFHSLEARAVPLRVLMIGPWSASVGGTVVSFRQLVQDLRSMPNVDVDLLDTGRGRPQGFGNLVAGLRTVAALIGRARRSDVIAFHASVRASVWFSPVVAFVARASQRPWILRVFGGNLDEYFDGTSRPGRFLMRRAGFAADVCVFQTRALVERFRPLCRNRVEWFPTSRPMPDDVGPCSDEGAVRFVYLGIVKPSKGIPLLIEASERLGRMTDGRAEVDVYGPLSDGMTATDFSSSSGIEYKGEIDHEDVATMLRRYDALVLPTIYAGEGYPGVILEAYGAGLPVIATRWRSIPELVDDEVGVLVEPGSVDDLVRGMVLLTDPDQYGERCAQVRLRREQFASSTWARRFAQWCLESADSA